MLEKHTIPIVTSETITAALAMNSSKLNRYQSSRFSLQSFKYVNGSGNVLLYAPFTIGHNHQKMVPTSHLIGSIVQSLTNCHFYYRQRRSNKTHSDKIISNHLYKWKHAEQLETIIQICKPIEHNPQQLTISIAGTNSSNLSTYQQLIEFIWLQYGYKPSIQIHLTDEFINNKFVTIHVHLPEPLHHLRNDERPLHKLLSAFTAMTFACQQGDVFTNEPMKPVKISANTRLTGIFPHHRVDLSPKLMAELELVENEYISVWNPLNGRSRRCVVKANPNFTADDDIQIGLSTKKKLDLTTGEVKNLVIQKYPSTTFNKIGVMNVNSIKGGNIIVSKNVYDSLDKKCSMFEMINTVTGSSFDIHRSNISCNPNLDDGTVRLNFLQRQFIDYELPPDILSDYYYHKFYNHPKADATVHDILKYYDNGQAVPFFPYIERQAVNTSLRQIGYVHAKLYPLYDYSVTRQKHSLLTRTKNWVAEKMIRQATLQLKVIRPYSTDEASNIVRVSTHSLKLLGLEETDTIILRNRAKEVKVRVLVMDSVELARETSIIPSESSMNVSIGIPAPIRNELDLKNVGKVIEVQRSLPYLFRKNLNLQFFSIIAAVLATLSTGLSIGYMIMILCILIPLSIYISFSKVRESISND